MLRRFVYSIQSDAPQWTPQLIADAGLLRRFQSYGDIVEHTAIKVESGPAGAPAYLVAMGSQPIEIRERDWVLSQNKRFYLAIDTRDLAPMPADLIRPIAISGRPIMLAQAAWQAPLLRRWSRDRLEHESALPKAIAMIDGKLKLAVLPEYRMADELAGVFWQLFVKGETLPIEKMFVLCSELLALNYRVESDELGLLGVLDAQGMIDLAATAVDLQAVREHSEALSFDGLEVTIEKERA